MTAGEQFTIEYPFYWASEADPETGADEGGWIPGTEGRLVPPDTAEEYADGIGYCVYTVVSTHRPGKYPTRVFYTREWLDPDGNEFGHKTLRVHSLGYFKRLIRGYRLPFQMSEVVS